MWYYVCMANNSNTPTLKQKLFAREYVKRKGNGRQAALAVYDTTLKNAHFVANSVLKKEVVQREIKQVLADNGMSLDDAGKDLRTIIDKGIESGKATASDALGAIREVFKLHNVYPANKSIKLSYSRNEQVAPKDIKDITAQLTKLNEATSKLLNDST